MESLQDWSGKLVPYSKFNCPSELPSLSSSSDNSVKVSFVPIKPRRIKKPTADLKDDQNDGKDDDCDNRELKQLRRRPQRRLQKTIGLMIKTTALHVHHAF